MPLSPHSSSRTTRWAVWALPARLVTSVLVVELLVGTLLVADGVHGGTEQFSRSTFAVLAALGGGGAPHRESARGVAPPRRRVALSPHIDLSSVWTFAAALLLPP